MTEKKCTKKRDARAQLLFSLFNLLLFWSSRCRRRRDILKSILARSITADGYFERKLTYGGRNNYCGYGWTVLLSSGKFFVKIYSLQENFPPCFLCFILHILLPKSNDKVVAEICIVEYTMTTVAHVRIHKNVKYHQNQINSHNQLETEQTREALPRTNFTHSQNVFM